MKAQYAVICEHQRSGQLGTFDMLGLYDRVFAPHVPVQHRTLTFVVQFVTDDETDLGKKEFRVRVRRPTGQPLFEQHGAFQVRPEGGSWLASARIALEFSGLILPDFGKYMFEVELGGEIVATHPLTVVQQAAPAT